MPGSRFKLVGARCLGAVLEGGYRVAANASRFDAMDAAREGGRFQLLSVLFPSSAEPPWLNEEQLVQLAVERFERGELVLVERVEAPDPPLGPGASAYMGPRVDFA